MDFRDYLSQKSSGIGFVKKTNRSKSNYRPKSSYGSKR